MKKMLSPLIISLCSAALVMAQSQDAAVKMEAVSIHTVERGSMPIFSSATGTLTSLRPPRAVLAFDKGGGKCDSGRDARLVLGDNSRPIAGKVVTSADAGKCEAEF